MTFGGITFDHDLDFQRLNTQLEKVCYAMTHPYGQWWRLSELSKLAGCSEAGASARVRDLRKLKFGGFIVERMRTTIPGIWVYRVFA